MEKRQCLNGFWDFSLDIERVGQIPQTWDSHKICVPSPFNINGFSKPRRKKLAGEEFIVQGGDFCLYPNYPKAWDDAIRGAYRRSFFVPEASRGQRVFLRFDAVAYHSCFYLNGRQVHEETEGFLPIEIEITDQVKYGADNEIIVVSENSKPYLYKDEKNWNRIDYPKGSFWGEYVAGIWQDVWYIERPRTFISDVFVTTDVYTGVLEAQFTLDGLPGKGAVLRFSLRDADTGELCSLGDVPAPAGRFAWQFADGEVKLWEVEAPTLYYLQTELLDGGVVLDSKEVRFGFRSFIAKGEKFYLNKRPIRLFSDSWHYMGYSVQTPEYARSYYKMAKDAGVNIIRLHAQPFPPFFYDIADEVGMLLMDESAVWASHCNFSYNDSFFANSRKHLARLLLRDRNHPSIVMWSPENECIPAYKVSGSKFIQDEKDLEAKLYDFLKVIYDYDISRPVSCDGSGDLGGRLPVNSLHYPGFDCPTGRGKPIAIGEMGSMYYSTPDMVCMEKGQDALRSGDGRLWAVGEEAYHNLMGERRWAAQVCVFNLVWYGLQPLPFRDRLLRYDDYAAPGIKPGRISSYLRTLNAGGDGSLPEYIPNPVWKLTQKAFLPVRSYIDQVPAQVFCGETVELPLFLFFDVREDGEMSFTFTVQAEGQPSVIRRLDYAMSACETMETTLSFPWPEQAGEARCTAIVTHNGVQVYEEQYTVELIDAPAIRSAFEAQGVPVRHTNTVAGEAILCCDTAALAEDASYEVEYLFAAGKKLRFSAPRRCARMEADGRPLYFDGAGHPLVWYTDAEGVRQIHCAFDLTAPVEAADWKLLTELAAYLKSQAVQAPRSILLYGGEHSPYAALLCELGYAYQVVDGQTLSDLLTEKQESILLADGQADLNFLSNISRDNFDTVVLAGLKDTPLSWCSEFRVTDRHIYHALPAEDAIARFGAYGNMLYGLTEREECWMGENLVEFSQVPPPGTIYWSAPNVDWRMWNKNPEQLKTVSLYRSEQADNSRLAVLSLLHHGESEIWINQLPADAESAKHRALWLGFLAGLGAGCPVRKAKTETTEALYENSLKRLWLPGGQPAEWSQVLPADAVLRCIAVSPQERTNFLYNPDMVHLSVRAERRVQVSLNGELLGEGSELRFTSIPLRAGDNILCLDCLESQPFPKITFERANGKDLDLMFKKPY